MSSEWDDFQLEDVADLNGGYAFKSEEYTETGHFVLRTVNITDDGRISTSGAVYVSSEIAKKYERFQLQELDTLFVMVGSTLGKTGLVTANDLPALLNQNMWVIRAKKGRVDPLYLHYAFKVLSKPLSSLASGSARGFVKRDDFRRMKIRLPELQSQKNISLLLGEIDDHITLLRETNQTLEAIAQAIFKSWFVDFDPVRAKIEGLEPEGMDANTAALFPDTVEESELGVVPRGWAVTSVRDVAEIVKGNSYSSKELAYEHTTALVTLKSFERGGGFRMDGFKPYIGVYKPSQVVSAGDLIVAYTDVTQAAELIGKPAIVVSVDEYDTLVASLDVGIVRPDTKKCGRQFLYGLFKTYSFQSHTFAHTSGTTVLHLSKDGVGSYSFALPPIELVQKFEEIASAIAERNQINADEIRTLGALRDTLLPRLISGQLPIAALKQKLKR